MKSYRCHKIVKASKIVAIHRFDDPPKPMMVELEDGTMQRVDGFRGTVEVGGYFVEYADNYQSYSPAKAFEDGYTLIDG